MLSQSQFVRYDVYVHYFCNPLKRCLCWMEPSCRIEWLPCFWEQPSTSRSKGIHISSSEKAIRALAVLGHLSLHVLCVSGAADSHLWGRTPSWQKEKLRGGQKGRHRVCSNSKVLTWLKTKTNQNKTNHKPRNQPNNQPNKKAHLGVRNLVGP